MSGVGVIIQARMGSSRLPGKVLKEIGKDCLLKIIMKRLSLLSEQVDVVIATSTEDKDSAIREFCLERGYAYFLGDEKDVLGRYYFCAKKNKFRHIVRMTADNPLTDISELGRLIQLHLEQGNDYTHSFGSLPLGVGAEIFTFNALERSYYEGLEEHHREHVNEYIQENPEKFIIGSLMIESEKSAPDIRLTVDTIDDYRMMCELSRKHPEFQSITTKQAIRFCSGSV